MLRLPHFEQASRRSQSITDVSELLQPKRRVTTSSAMASISPPRLEGIAEPGGICISEDALQQVRGKVEAEFPPQARFPVRLTWKEDLP